MTEPTSAADNGREELGQAAVVQKEDDSSSEAKKGAGVTQRRMLRESVTQYVAGLQNFHISFQDLSVYVPREKGCCQCTSNENTNCCSPCTCLCTPLQNLLAEYCGYAVSHQDAYYALRETSGYVTSGQMLLVLSPDTQFSSALIQTLTGRLSNNYSICGSLRVNGTPIPPDAWQGWRRIAAHVSADDATHAPILTVRETLEFAAACTRSMEESADHKIDDVVNDILEILDLSHVADTIVGDENVRGVSGGQKRRVTVGEMLVAKGTRFLGLENITDGLSSQDSFRIVEELKQACTSLKTAAVISLNQPSDEIVALFDNVLVLNHQGEMTYFGPTSDRVALQKIFATNDTNNASDKTNLEGGSICDICLNPMTGDDESIQVIQNRFLASSQAADLDHQLRFFNSKTAMQQTVNVTELLPDTKYASGMGHNFRILGKRRALLIVRNPSTYMRILVAIFFGVVVGSLFSVLEQDVGSSLARTAFMFQSMFLVLLLSTGVSVPQNIRDRVTYFKHRSAEFYSARVNYVCQILYDLPLGILEAILLSVITYFWVDLNPNAGRFFFFCGVLIAAEFVGLACGRLFCAISRTQVVAKSVVSVVTLLFSTVSGFMPKYQQIPAIFKWMSWLSPTAYGFEALAINEYVGRELALASISNSDGLSTSVGSLSGEEWLTMMGLPRVGWTSLQGIKIFDIIFLFLMSIVIDLIGFALIERSRKNFALQIRRPQKTSKSFNFAPNNGSGETPEPSTWPSSLTVTDLCYYVPLKGDKAPKRCSIMGLLGPWLLGKIKGDDGLEIKTQEKRELQLLDNVSATFTAGRATALMGTSGAGKTTLLDVIAGYKTGGRITGNLCLSGLPKDKQMWQLMSGYAEQLDILNPYLTLLETLKFTAACRLPASTNRAAVIDKTIKLMSLEDWTDMVVGSEKDGEGLPKHVRKRLTIAVQLVTLPKILFLDEPTTGLGTSAANLVMQAIRRSTTELNLITVATIHQPSKLIWDSFDDLLLLCKGGKVAYMGEMGAKSATVLSYFSRIADAPMEANANPADYVITSVSGVPADDAKSIFMKSDEHNTLTKKIEKDTELSENEKEAAIKLMAKTKVEVQARKSFFRELTILTKRQVITQWRNPGFSMVRLVCSLCLSVYFGILFSGDKSTINGAVATIGSTFFLVFVLVVPMQAAVVPLIDDRAVLYRETTSGLYSRWSYAIASVLADIPFHVLNTVVMFVGFYFIIEFQLDGDRPGYFVLMLFLLNWAFTSIGEVYAITTPNEEAANGLAGLTTILSVMFMGFLITADAMPSGWQWANTADLLRYTIQGLTTNELSGKHYKLFPEDNNDRASNATLFGDVGNSTEMFLFPTGTDTSEGSDASQAATFLNMVIKSNPDREAAWNSSLAGAVGGIYSCGTENDCFVEPVATNFMSCFVFRLGRGGPPCEDEWEAGINALGDSAGPVADCLFNSFGTDDAAESDQIFASLPSFRRDQTVECLLNAILPAGALDKIVDTIEVVADIGAVVIDVAEALSKGIPGEIILWVFGWAEFRDDGLEAPWKWWYCMFAVAMFIAGLEFFKLVGTLFIVWTKR